MVVRMELDKVEVKGQVRCHVCGCEVESVAPCCEECFRMIR